LIRTLASRTHEDVTAHQIPLAKPPDAADHVTRQRIIESALRLAIAREPLTPERITRFAGLDERQFQEHFDEMSTLWYCVLLHVRDRMRRVRDGIDDGSERGPERAERGVAIALDVVEHNESRYRGFRMAMEDQGALGRQTRKLLGELFTQLARELCEQRGTHESPELLGQSLLGQFIGIVDHWVEHRTRWTRAQIEQFIVQAMGLRCGVAAARAAATRLLPAAAGAASAA